MPRQTRHLLCGGIALVFASAAHADPAMFQASFILHAWGEGKSISGVYNPFTYMPIPADCHAFLHAHDASVSDSGPVLETHGSCHLSTMYAKSATGSGVLSQVPTGTGPAGIVLPQSAFGITTYEEWPTVYLTTYATFHNAAASFFAGSGPAAGGTVTKTGMGPPDGTWIIQPGEHAFGGPMGILGQLGAYEAFTVSTQTGYYQGYASWNMIKALGRERLGGPDPLNPYTNTVTFMNTLAGVTATTTLYGTGTPWTTGHVTLYAPDGYFTTVMRRSGYDTTSVTSLGDTVRNIQLVTPALTHWRDSGGATYNTGHVGVFRLHIVPEPGSVLMLAVGAGVLVGLRRVSRRSRRTPH